jgi:hypothetical protein
MLTMIAAAALAAAQPQAPAPAAGHPQHSQTGPTVPSNMDNSSMDHSKMGQSGGGCCKRTAEGKMECAMMSGNAGGSTPKGRTGQ